MRRIFLSFVAFLVASFGMAQNATNSPYSQYGLGIMADQANGNNKAMDGLGMGWREHNQINFQNPASYAALDSLSMILDVGISGQVTNFTEGNHRLNANNSSFDYVVAAFRMFKHVGVSVGMMPYSNIGYNFYNNERVGKPGENQSVTTYTNTYTGSGGLQQVYLGVGVEPLKGLSVGVNAGYLWGNYSKAIVNSYSDDYVNTLSKFYSASVQNYKLDFGAQYELKLSKNDKVTLGATYSPGHKLGANPQCDIISTNSQSGVADTTIIRVENGLSMPTSFGAGLVYNHANKWRVGFDYKVQKWGGEQIPVYSVVNDKPQYTLTDGQLMDSHRYTLGGEYCRNERARGLFPRIRYRLGASMATPYVKINGQDGPKEYSVSGGLGIPIMNHYEDRSMLHLSVQWVQRTAPGMIRENNFRLNIGLTFNERWFAKWKLN